VTKLLDIQYFVFMSFLSCLKNLRFLDNIKPWCNSW